ncbi:MAG: FHA domain-containing protein [Planctomycetes bacterium]|nr:FHA domain-containing protein [Planctomycetota bacterium]
MRWNPCADVKEGLEYVSQVTVEPQPRSNHAQILLVCRGRGDDRPGSVAVRQGLTLIGSRAGCRIRLRSANVAAQHCAIVRVGEQLFLRDLASTSGTIVNGSEATSIELSVGDTIRIHRWEFDVTTEGQAAERAGGNTAGPVRPATRVTVADAAEKRLFETANGVLLIGRNGRCDVTLQDGRASRAHALIFPTDTGWSIADLMSANGTYVAQRKIQRVQGLARESRIKIGETELAVRLLPETKQEVAEEAAIRKQSPAAAEFAEREADLRHRSATASELEESLRRRIEEVERRALALAEQAQAVEAGRSAFEDGVEQLKRERRNAAAQRRRQEARSESLKETARSVDEREKELERERTKLEKEVRGFDERLAAVMAAQDALAANASALARNLLVDLGAPVVGPRRRAGTTNELHQRLLGHVRETRRQLEDDVTHVTAR